MCKSGCGWWFHVVSTSLLEKHGFKLQQTCWWFNKFFVQILWPGWTVWRDGERDGERVGEREWERSDDNPQYQCLDPTSRPFFICGFHLLIFRSPGKSRCLVGFWHGIVRFLCLQTQSDELIDPMSSSIPASVARQSEINAPRSQGFWRLFIMRKNNLSGIDGVGPLRWPLTTVCFEENGWIEEFAGKKSKRLRLSLSATAFNFAVISRRLRPFKSQMGQPLPSPSHLHGARKGFGPGSLEL